MVHEHESSIGTSYDEIFTSSSTIVSMLSVDLATALELCWRPSVGM